MAMQKLYNRTYWENYPSDATAINETRLNNAESGIDGLDDRIITLDVTKFDKTDAAGMFVDVTIDTKTGVITFTQFNGATKTIDTLINKLAVNFDFDEESQKLIIYLEDGTTKEVDLSAFITEYEFLDSDTIAFEVTQDGKVIAKVKNGSITGEHLRPDYLADVTAQADLASQKAEEATRQRDLAEMEADRAKAEADKAANYSSIIVPDFYVDLDTMALYQKGASGINFVTDENATLYWKITA